MLRTACLNVARWLDVVKNEEVYIKTKTEQWSKITKKIMEMVRTSNSITEDSPARIALKHANANELSKCPRRKPLQFKATTLIAMMTELMQLA